MKQENEDGAQADYSLRAFFRTVLRLGNTYDFMIVKCLRAYNLDYFLKNVKFDPCFLRRNGPN